MVSGFAPGPSATMPDLEKLNCCTMSKLVLRLRAVYCRQNIISQLMLIWSMSSTKHMLHHQCFMNKQVCNTQYMPELTLACICRKPRLYMQAHFQQKHRLPHNRFSVAAQQLNVAECG